jgi:hypothetical protein
LIEDIKYIKFNRSLKSIVKKYSCINCKGEKIKESNLIKYGVTSVAKLQSSKDKSIETNLERYGVDNPMKSETIKDRVKETNLERYGVDNPMKSKKINTKQKKKVFELYGVDNISKLEVVKNKKKKTLLKNWGVDSPIKNSEIRDRIDKTNLEKYGNKYFTKVDEFREKNYDISKNINYLSYIDNGISLFRCDLGEDHDFSISKDVYSKRILYRTSLCTVCNKISDTKSIKEEDIFRYIKSIYDGKIIQSYRDGLEIDIYLPELNIGFEFNGLYWHSEKFKDKNYHLNKTNHFKKKGIRIIHIWEDDWNFKNNIIKSQIKSWIGLVDNRVFARKCYIKEINDNSIVRDFLNTNHIQGHVNSVLKLGLYHKEDLLSIMTFNKFEGRKKMVNNGWNLNRFCNLLNTSVLGGASKLLKYFELNYDTKRIISYADVDWSDGLLYHNIGFELINKSNPDYKYIIDGIRKNKSNYRNSNTKYSIKIWDCGKMKFEKFIQKI